MYLGDFKEDGDIFFKFTTRAFATGIPTVLAGTPVLSVYKDEGGAATEKTTAETYFDLDVSHDSIVGWNNVRIDLNGDAFFATGADYAVVITTGTVDSVSVVGENIATFSIENRSMGQPAGATLAADIAALKAETALIVADTNELQVDNIPGTLSTIEGKVDTLDTVADGIQTDLSNATDGLGALKALIDTADTAIDVAVADLANGTDGLGALKALIDTVNSDLANGTDGLGALKALIDTLDTVADAIKVVTDKFAFTVANQVDANTLQIEGADATDTINAQVDAALDTAISELGVAVPTATPTIRTALMLLYMALRNKTITQTSGTDALEIHNDAGTKITKKLLTDDGADYAEAKMS